MKSNELNELSQPLISEEGFFGALKFLAIVGTAGGFFFCLYSYLSSGNHPIDNSFLEDDNQTTNQNSQKKNEAPTFIFPTSNPISDNQIVVREQQQGTTYNTAKTKIGNVYNINNATFALDGLPKEIESKLEDWMENWAKDNLEKIQQGTLSEYKLLQEKNEELEGRLAEQKETISTLVEVINSNKEALNIIALYALKVNMEQCDIAKVLIALEKTLTKQIFTIEDEKKYLENIQNVTLEEAKVLFGNSLALSGAVELIEEAIVELSGDNTTEHSV